MHSSRSRPSISATTAVDATLTRTTWSRPTRLKLFSRAMQPWISCALIMAVSTAFMVSGGLPAATALRDSQSATARMPPRLSLGWPHSAASPGIVEVQPANHGADVEGGLDGIELELGAGDPGAVGHDGAGHDGAEQLGAGGVIKRLQAAAERIDQAVARRLVGEVGLDVVAKDIIDDVGKDGIGFGADVGDVGGHGQAFLRRSLWKQFLRRPRKGTEKDGKYPLWSNSKIDPFGIFSNECVSEDSQLSHDCGYSDLA